MSTRYPFQFRDKIIPEARYPHTLLQTLMHNPRHKLITLALVLCFLTQAPAHAQQRQLRPPDARLNAAYKAVDEGHLDAGKAGLLPYVNTAYAGEYFYTKLAEACLPVEYPETMDLPAARRYCEKALSLNRDFGVAYEILGKVALLENKQKLAIELFTRAINSKEPFTFSLLARAQSYAAEKQPQLALKDLDALDVYMRTKRAVDVVNTKVSFRTRAQILQSLGRYSEALAYYKKCLPQCNSEMVEKQIIACQLATGQFSPVIDKLSRSIKADPQNDEAYFERAKAKMAAGQTEAAVQDFSRAIELMKTSTYFKARAAAYRKLGQTKLAEKGRGGSQVKRRRRFSP